MVSSTSSADRLQSLFTIFSDQMRTALERSSRLNGELAQIAIDNIEALSRSATIAATGAETVLRESTEQGRRAVQSTLSAARKLGSARSPQDVMDLQAEFGRTGADAAVAEAARMTETLTNLTGEIIQPLASQYDANVERLKAAFA